MTKKFLSVIILFNFFLLSNIYWEPEIPSIGDTITIYYNTDSKILPNNTYPIYINIELDNEIIKSPMDYIFWKGSNIWGFNFLLNSYNESINFYLSDKSSNNQSDQYIIDLKTNYYFDIYNEAKLLLENGDIMKAIKSLNIIIEENSKSEIAAKSLYLISEIYLNDYNNYYLSVERLKEIINQYPHFNVFKKALFSLAYIYANHLNYYSDAIDLYEKFINIYPNDDLTKSVKYELNLLYKYQPIIDSLSNIK